LLTTVSSTLARPMSGSQLYAQRLEAIRQGKTYTRLPVNSFQDRWQEATYHPHYEDWLALLDREADAMAQGQGNNRLTVMLGDSLSQWFPNDQLPGDRFWLNQGISGDTSAGVLRRLSLIDQTRPDVIHVMVGINDLRGGATDAEVLTNLETIMKELHQRHPSAQIYIHSLLPTRLPAISNDRITALNSAIAQTAQRENVAYLDLQTTFSDDDGNLRLELTTDGLHLSRYGYALWQSALRWFQLA
jgi:lysophospholipase L1-like esterase